jgi:hypothetical protein
MEAITDVNSDIFTDALATWERERSSEELKNFIERHHAVLPSVIDVE